MRNVALIFAALVIVVGAVVGSVLVVGSDDTTTTDQRAASSATRPLPTPSVTPTPDRFTLAEAGLRRVITRHTPTAARPTVPLTSCPFAPGVPLASKGLRAAGVPTGRSDTETVDVEDWAESGDHGIALTCWFAGPRAFSAAAHTRNHVVGRAPYPGFDGPIAFGGGNLYRSTNDNRCAAYWAPPNSDYVIAVQFVAPKSATAGMCGAALRAVQPTIFAGLLRLQRGH